MPTINVNRQGHATGVTSGNFNTARTSNASSVTDGISATRSIQYFSSGRGKRFQRAFLHFDTSGITGTLSAAHIDVTGGGSSPDPNDTIMIKSTAFGGDGGTALATSDFYSSLDYSTAYSTELTTWNASSNNEYTLTAAALADIKNNDNFTIAIINNDADFANTDTGTVDDIQVAFGTTITLDYTLAATGYGNNVNGVASANIAKVDEVETANIEKIIGV